MKNSKWLRRAVLAGAILTTPLMAFPALVAFNSISPLLLAFLDRFEVVNNSGEAVWITPLGAAGQAGERRVLPQYAPSVPAFVSPKQNDHPVAPGESASITYDWDDVNLSELVIRNESGDYKVLVVVPEPTVGQPSGARYVVPPLDELADAPPDVVEASRRGNLYLWTWAMLLSSMLPILLFLWWLPLRKRPARALAAT